MAHKWTGFNPPFVGGTRNVLSPQTDDRLIKNDIKQLLLTVPGERVHRPDFGTMLRTWTFENYNEGDVTALKMDIATQLALYEPRVTLVRVDVIPSFDEQLVRVQVEVALRDGPTQNLLVEVSVDRRGAR